MAPSLMQRVADGQVLTRAEAEAAMEEILSGRVETPEIVSLLLGMNARPIHPQELAGFATIEGVTKLRTYFFHIDFRSALSYFFIRRKQDADFAVFYFRMGN